MLVLPPPDVTPALDVAAARVVAERSDKALLLLVLLLLPLADILARVARQEVSVYCEAMQRPLAIEHDVAPKRSFVSRGEHRTADRLIDSLGSVHTDTNNSIELNPDFKNTERWFKHAWGYNLKC